MKTRIRIIAILLTLSLFAGTAAAAGPHTTVVWHANKAAAVSLTFDDGYPSQYSTVLPALEARGLKGTFFLATDFPDYYNMWDSWKDAANKGHEIGSHTKSHPFLTSLPLSEADYQLTASQSLINTKIPGQKTVTFAYPYGMLNSDVKALAQKYYIAGRGTGEALNDLTADTFNMPAYDAARYTVGQFEDLTSQAVTLNKWLIPCFHSFSPGEYGGWTPEQLTTYLDYLKGRADLWVAPFGTVIKYMRERSAATLSLASQSSDKITLNLTDTLDDAVFDQPLTLRSEVPSAWSKVKVLQGTTVNSITSVTEGSVSVIYYDAIPDKGVITLSNQAVNLPPVAANDSYSTNKNVVLTLAAPGVLANDTDPEGTTLTAQLVTSPLHGTLTLSANGSFVYTPTANYSGSDSFTYRASDGSLTSTAASVNITVAPVNQPPVAANDSYSTNKNVVLTLAAPGVLANDTDPEGTTLTAQLVTSPLHGTLTLSANGSFVYTPTANYSGSDSFTYRASDGSLTSTAASVNITVAPVNQPPVAANDSYSTNQNVVLTLAAPGVLANDTDPEGTTLTAQLVTSPLHGTVTLSANGSFVYTPTANYSGSDSFTYRASDGSLTSGITTVGIAVIASAIFSDDFNRTPTPPELVTPWINQMGSWKITGSALQGLGSVSAYYGYAYTAPTPLWSNYTVDGRVQFPAGSYGGGLGGRLNPATGAHYGVWIYPDGSQGGSNQMKLVKFSDWTTWSGTAMNQVSLTSVGTGWHTVKLIFNGSRIQVYYDGTLKIDVTDNNFDSRAAYLSGGISADLATAPGFTGSVGMVIDDVVVTLNP